MTATIVTQLWSLVSVIGQLGAPAVLGAPWGRNLVWRLWMEGRSWKDEGIVGIF